MAVIPVDASRFDATAPKSEGAESQRISVTRNIIPNVRPPQSDNGDFSFADKRGSFTKGLLHDASTGLVDQSAMNAFVNALGQPRDSVFAAIEALPDTDLGSGANTRKWVSPIAGRAFSVTAGDPQQYGESIIPPAPKFGSRELTFEMAENYWMAHLRDVPFSQYRVNSLAAQAAAELSTLRSDAVAERAASMLPVELIAPVDGANNITPATLFRGLSVGDDKGPYLSQFLCHPVPFGVQGFRQVNKTLKPGRDFMTEWNEWLAVQNGAARDFNASDFDDELRYTRNGRDLCQWVHIDVLFQGYFNACLVLLQGAASPSAVGGGIGADRSASNVYGTARHQAGFATLGDPAHIGMMCEVAAHALKAVWFQKWYVHMRLRPEAYAGRVDYQRRNPAGPLFGIPAALMNSQAVAKTVTDRGSALLPMAFPEGSPMHPAYGAGHATVAGACVTILKALFDGSGKFPNPVDVVVDTNGKDHLVPYVGPDGGGGNDLTIEGELNKLASNVAIGRNIAGVHWRSDATYSLRLGEQVAIDVLQAYARSYAEFTPGSEVFHFQRFDGTPVSIATPAMMAMAT